VIGQLWEYFRMCGSANYAWTGIIGNLIDQFGFNVE
jgi:hypothetical protein